MVKKLAQRRILWCLAGTLIFFWSFDSLTSLGSGVGSGFYDGVHTAQNED